MNEETILRDKARYLLATGKLPDRRPDRVWGGAGYGGSLCILCGGLVRHDQVALEIEYGNAVAETNYRLHIPCFLALEVVLTERELRKRAVPGDETAADSRSALPGHDATATMPGHGEGQPPAGGSA